MTSVGSVRGNCAADGMPGSAQHRGDGTVERHGPPADVAARVGWPRGQPDASPPRRPPGDEETLAGLSARNRLRGFVHEVRVDGLLAQVRLRVGDQWLTAVMTAEAVRR